MKEIVGLLRMQMGCDGGYLGGGCMVYAPLNSLKETKKKH